MGQGCVASLNPSGISDDLVARKNRKIIILTNEQLNIWNDIKDKIMDDILLAKFTQIPEGLICSLSVA